MQTSATLRFYVHRRKSIMTAWREAWTTGTPQPASFQTIADA
jgi:hypothetical protein